MAQLTLFADLSHDPITLTTRLAPSALPLGVQLRPTGPEDAAALARLRLASEQQPAEEALAGAAAEVSRQLAGEQGAPLPDGCQVAVDEQGEVIASVLTVRPEPGPGTAGAPRLLDLRTAPPWQGRGLGRALVLSAMRAAAAEAERIELRVDGGNEDALSLLRSLGFAPVGSAS